MGNARSGRRPGAGRKPPTTAALTVHPGGRQGITPGLPEAPEEVTADPLALGFYERIGGYLLAQGWMAHEFGDALVTVATVSADHARAREQFRKIGNTAFHSEKDRHGQVRIVEAPILRRLMQLAALRMRVLGDIGLTPLMAAKVHAGRQPAGAASKFTARKVG